LMTPYANRYLLFPYTTLFRSIALAGEPSQAWLSMTGLLKNTYRKLGGKDYWQERLEVARNRYDQHTVTPKAVAEIYAILGNKERSEEHTSDQSRSDLVCRLLL